MYITYMDFYREYHSIIGYQRNRNSGELWLEPNLPASMNDTLKNGFYISPEGDGTISFTQDPTTFEQRILFRPDSAVPVNQIYVKDKYGATLPPVWVNGTAVAAANVTRIGMGYGKELKINWSGTVSPSTGLDVEVATTPTTGILRPAAVGAGLSAEIKTGRQLDIRYSINRDCNVSISLYHGNGQKIAAIVDRTENAGTHYVSWSAARNSKVASTMCVVVITAGEQKEVRKVMLLAGEPVQDGKNKSIGGSGEIHETGVGTVLVPRYRGSAGCGGDAR